MLQNSNQLQKSNTLKTLQITTWENEQVKQFISFPVELYKTLSYFLTKFQTIKICITMKVYKCELLSKIPHLPLIPRVMETYSQWESYLETYKYKQEVKKDSIPGDPSY